MGGRNCRRADYLSLSSSCGPSGVFLWRSVTQRFCWTSTTMASPSWEPVITCVWLRMAVRRPLTSQTAERV